MPRKSDTHNLKKSRTGGKYASNQTWPDAVIGAVNPDPGRVFNMTYAEQIKSPKWQKKRLNILDRDKYTCMSCFEEEKTLHVHHLAYHKNKSIWQYEDNELITLCEDCHKTISNDFDQIKSIIQRNLTNTEESDCYLKLVKSLDNLPFWDISFITRFLYGISKMKINDVSNRHHNNPF